VAIVKGEQGMNDKITVSVTVGLLLRKRFRASLDGMSGKGSTHE